MYTDIHITHVEPESIRVKRYDDPGEPWYVISIGTGPDVLELYATPAQAVAIATQILNEEQGAAQPIITPFVSDVTILCDHCGEPVVSDGDLRHNGSFEWWTHEGGTRGTFCYPHETGLRGGFKATVNGSRRVADYIRTLAAE